MTGRLLHVWVLAAFAVAQPLYDVLRRNGEFFVAHQADPLDILLLAATLSVFIPAILVGLLWIAARASPAAGRAAVLATVAICIGLMAMQALRAAGDFGTAASFAAAAVAGALGAWVYSRFAAARQILTVLSPAIVLFPALFLVHGDMRSLVRPGRAFTGAAADVRGDTPVVMVVFDQLPLVSLMAADGHIDAGAFPAFAALERDALWFRNATTVADLTAWALPALLTGTYPVAGRLPIAADHPGNLFTLLGGRYRIEAIEPITQLCPASLCAGSGDPRVVRQLSMLSDLTVVYPRIFLPPALAAALPPLTDNWRDFARNQNWHRRWGRARDRDRRVPPAAFIDSIGRDDAQPTLYFMHALLPHEPYIYMKHGTQFSTQSSQPGLTEGQWTGDEWLVSQSYQQHLLQVQYVDAILGRLVARLRAEGLYDRALIVVTSDHGVAFTPRRPFKAITDSTIPGIAPVPLFIKAPFSQGGTIDDRNVQSVDVLPTIARILGIDLPWIPAGMTAMGDAAPPSGKTLYYNGAERQRALPASMGPLVTDFVQRKLALFGPSGHERHWRPAASPAPELLDRAVDTILAGAKSDLAIRLHDQQRFSDVDPGSGFVPARLTGEVLGPRGAAERLPLAIAVNGVVRATTWSIGRSWSPEGFWAAIVPPDSLGAGGNTIDLYAIDTASGAPRLRHALKVGPQPDDLNLAGSQALEWDTRQEGLHDPEDAGGWFRWTNGNARIVAPTLRSRPPERVRVALAPLTRARTRLTIAVNGCAVFDEELPGGAWDRTFPLDRCGAALFSDGEARIELKSTTFQPRGGDARTLGVPLSTLQLLTAATR